MDRIVADYARFSPEGVRLRISAHGQWQKRNPEKCRAKQKRWRDSNLEVCRERDLRRAKENPGKANARTARRRAAKFAATPKWLSADDLEMMRYLYEEAASFSKETGVKFHVDHIVPLRGKTVSGLHVPWNLRIVAASRNLSKGNKFSTAR